MPKKPQLQEIKKCQQSFKHFCRYLKLIDKQGDLVTFKPNKAQKAFYQELDKNPWTYCLKARQLGMSTAIAARYFWKVLFTPNYKIAVIAHTSSAAKNIFEIYTRFYKSLPKFLKFKTEASSVNELKFFHGGSIKVSSAGSAAFRGSTFNSLHLSELCYYTDLQKTISAIFQTATDDAEIIVETTANGLNSGYKFWVEQNGFNKFFLPWWFDKGYASTSPTTKTTWEMDYQRAHKLTNKQIGWVRYAIDTKCGGDINIFNQEYPATAEIAFITSGTNFFNTLYKSVVRPGKDGLIIYQEPVQYRSYIIGVDTASGDPEGDYSAAVVIDASHERQIEVVATHYVRKPMIEFSKDVLDLALKYDALVTVESNSYGLAVLEYLQTHAYPHLYRRASYDKLGDKYIEKLGYNTNMATRPLMLAKLQEWTNKKWLKPVCNRIKYEINSFVYNEKGKAEAAPGQHDDLIFAIGLALMGIDQVYAHQQAIELKHRPTNIADMIKWEMATGKKYADCVDDFDNSDLEDKLSEVIPSF